MSIKKILFVICIFLTTWCHAFDYQQTNQWIKDAIITTKITMKYTRDKSLNPLKIGVSTTNGHVTLIGFVKSKQAYVKALRLARNTKGVTQINTDDLSIKLVNTSFKDAYITAKVEAAILRAKVFSDESIPLVGINATTNNGVVTLDGELNSEHAINAILNYVAGVKGVKKVVSGLQVASTHEKTD